MSRHGCKVLVPLAPAASVVSRFVDDAARLFAGLGVDPRFVDVEGTEMSEHCVAKTASRSVVGTMNDFAFLANVHRDERDADDLIGLSPARAYAMRAAPSWHGLPGPRGAGDG